MFEEDELGSQRCYPLPKVTVLGKGGTGMLARVHRTPEEAEDPLEEGLDEMKGRGLGSEGREGQDTNQVAALLVGLRAAASNGASEGPGLRERWRSPSPSASQQAEVQASIIYCSPQHSGSCLLGLGRSMQSWMVSCLYWATLPWLTAFVNLRLTVL